MATFGGTTFSERGGGAGQRFPLWSASASVNVILIPGGAPVLQTGGNPPETIDLPFQCNTSQYSTLKSKKGQQHTLVIATGTYQAILADINGDEVTATANVVQGVMKFMKVGS